jgi:hypothetical protein
MESGQDGLSNMPRCIRWCSLWLSGDWPCRCGKMLNLTRYESDSHFCFSSLNWLGLIVAACHLLCKDHHTVAETSSRDSWQATRNKHLLQHQAVPYSLPSTDCTDNTHRHILPVFHQCRFHQGKVKVIEYT